MILSNAPVSWGVYFADTAPITAETYLDEIAEAGYRGTELGPLGFMPEDPARLTDMLEARGLSLIGAVIVHDFVGPEAELKAMLDRAAPLLKAGGAQVATLMDAGVHYGDPQMQDRIAAALDPAAKRLASEHGLELAFHPHVLTDIETEAQIDRLLEQTRVGLCFDVGHHAFWGADPAAYMERVRDRISVIHLKNVDVGLVDQVAKGQLTARQAVDKGAFCPLDAGAVDIPAFLDRLGDFNGPVVIEQDWMPSAAEPPISLAKRNAELLKKG